MAACSSQHLLTAHDTLPPCRPSQQKHFPPSRRLLFHVLKGMPRLELAIAGLPTAAAAGELLRVQVGRPGASREEGRPGRVLGQTAQGQKVVACLRTCLAAAT